MTKPSSDYVARRVNRVTDTIGALWACAQARRLLTNEEGERLYRALRQLDEMLRHEQIIL